MLIIFITGNVLHQISGVLFFQLHYKKSKLKGQNISNLNLSCFLHFSPPPLLSLILFAVMADKEFSQTVFYSLPLVTVLHSSLGDSYIRVSQFLLKIFQIFSNEEDPNSLSLFMISSSSWHGFCPVFFIAPDTLSCSYSTYFLFYFLTIPHT